MTAFWVCIVAYFSFVAFVGAICLLSATDSDAEAQRAYARIFLGLLLPPLGIWLVTRRAFPPSPPTQPDPIVQEAEAEAEAAIYPRSLTPRPERKEPTQ